MNLRQLTNKFANHVRRGEIDRRTGQQWREDIRGKCTRCARGNHGNSTGQQGSRRFVRARFEPLSERAKHLGCIKISAPICAVCAIKETNT